MNYWLMKSEPSVFSIQDLCRQPLQTDCWNGVRNYQARNMLRDAMKLSDLAFFYHSNCDEPGIVGIMEIVSEGYPDCSAFEAGNHYFDAKSDPNKPGWMMVDVKHVRTLARTITLKELKLHPELSEFTLLRRGNRLSIMKVTPEHWAFILALE